MMTHRERFEAALRHTQTDRAPMDLAGTSLTGLETLEMMERLAAHLGYPPTLFPTAYKKFDERILKHLDIDFRRVGDILEPKSALAQRTSKNRYTDCWGVTRRFTGQYWEIVDPPLMGATIDGLDVYPWPKAEDLDPARLRRYGAQAKRLFEQTDYVICGEHPVYGVFELGCWMCGFDWFLMQMALEPEFVIRFFDIVLAYQKRVIEMYYGEIGRYIHFTTSGDDFGTQTGPFISPGMFREMIKPYYASRIAYTRKFTDAYYFHHSCGGIFPLIDDLIDAGVDILNPMQPGAKDMEPEKLKQAFGDRVTFMGGVDTQHLLPGGTVEEVRSGVRSLLGVMAKNGGFILAPAHIIQPDVPVENIAAIYVEGAALHPEPTG